MASVRSPLSSESEGELFEVERILGKRTRNGKVEYLVHWKGFGPDEDSWEPVKNLRGCHSIIKQFTKTRSPSPGRKARTSKRNKAVQQVQSKEEVQPVDEDYTKLKTPNTSESSDYRILRRRKGPLPYKSEAKEEKQEVVTTKVQSVEETNIKQEKSVVNKMPIKRSPVNEATTKTMKGRQEVLKVFATLLVFTFIVILLLSFVREVGDRKSKNNS